ncbi:MAG TPA: hypothetical protein P5274_02250, partial [Candidatus Paceibacterota bacterium]|nr:hypothetical protein [Candidatus Paceibacterota bacterium]
INNRGLNKGQFATSKQWAHGQSSVTNHYSWDNAIYEYVYGDKQKGLLILGHTIHLVQDKFVPAHTRDDAHPLVETYETYAKDRTSVLGSNLVSLSSLDNYFDSAANFSNTNFFSDDTILKDYNDPEVVNESKELGDDNNFRNYGYNSIGNKLVLITNGIGSDGRIEKIYNIYDKNDNKIMADYWSVLAPRAVGYSAGVIKLFLVEVEKEKLTGEIKKARTPWWQELLVEAKLRIDDMLASISLVNQTPTNLLLPNPVNPNSSSTTLLVDPAVLVVDLPVPISNDLDLKKLTELETKLKQLRVQLDALAEAEAKEEEVMPVIHSVNQVLSSAGAHSVVIEEPLVDIVATTTATSTATTTEEVAPPEPSTISLEIESCTNSLTPDLCLLVSTSTLSFSWMSTPSREYTYDLIKLTQTFDDDDEEVWEREIVASTTGATLELETGIDLTDYPLEFGWQVEMKLASTSEVVASSSILFTLFHPRPLVINEVAWSGMSTTTLDTDEWLELRNFVEPDISLDDYYLTDVDETWRINLAGLISGKGYYLIERGSDEVVSNRSADLVEAWGSDPLVKIFNSCRVGVKLFQERASGDQLIDETPVWDKSSSLSGSIERNWERKSSEDLSAWEDNQECFPSDGPCALDRYGEETFGTPGIINRASIPRLW